MHAWGCLKGKPKYDLGGASMEGEPPGVKQAVLTCVAKGLTSFISDSAEHFVEPTDVGQNYVHYKELK